MPLTAATYEQLEYERSGLPVSTVADLVENQWAARARQEAQANVRRFKSYSNRRIGHELNKLSEKVERILSKPAWGSA